MRTLIPFLKPYKGLILLILIITIVDVGGTLYIPTLVADMINIGVYSGNLALVLQKGALMFGRRPRRCGSGPLSLLFLRPPVGPPGPGPAQRLIRPLPDLFDE